jgi:hypothetical protein
MGEGPSRQSWWQTLPGILTATAAVITALTGAILGLYQVGVFTGGGRSAPQANPTTAPQPQPKVFQGSGASAPSPVPVSTPASAQYSVTFPAGTEATAGAGVYRVLAARPDRYSSDKLSLRLTVRLTAVTDSLTFTSNEFRLFVDGVPRAPDDAPALAVNQQSARDGDVVFVISAAEQHLVLQVGQVGHETSTIPIDLKAASR